MSKQIKQESRRDQMRSLILLDLDMTYDELRAGIKSIVEGAGLKDAPFGDASSVRRMIESEDFSLLCPVCYAAGLDTDSVIDGVDKFLHGRNATPIAWISILFDVRMLIASKARKAV